jgi:uncharacterized repeat protein (TIGR03803 family)
MSIPNFKLYATSFCACVVLLTGCGGGSGTLLSPLPDGLAPARTNVRPAYGVIYSFDVSDGEYPSADLTNVNGTLYGTTQLGGKYGQGAVFKTTTSGKETLVNSFKSEGSSPSAGLTEVNGTLYGTITGGGTNSDGAVFAISSGKVRLLHSFGVRSQDGGAPVAPLINVNGTLYGTTRSGGKDSIGTVFSITPSGKETVLHSFDVLDGDQPLSGLLDVNGVLYGTTTAGGKYGEGAVFSITTSGKETILYSFRAESSDGQHPAAGLINVEGTLYGTTSEGGRAGCYDSGCGTVFSITTAGKEKVLHRFGRHSDGALPNAGLIDVNDTLYGTTESGGTQKDGTVFAISLSGKETLLHSFDGSEGKQPLAGLIDVKGTPYGKDTLYGTTSEGGHGCGEGCGVVFYLPLD